MPAPTGGDATVWLTRREPAQFNSMRRTVIFAAALAAATLLAACSTPTQPADTTSAADTASTRVTTVAAPSDRPLRLAVVGDQFAAAYSTALQAALEGTDIHVTVAAGGFLAAYGDQAASPSLDDIWAERIRITNPDVVIVTNPVVHPRTDCVGSDEERAACERFADEVVLPEVAGDMIDTLAAHGARIIWVDYPAVAPEAWLAGSATITDTALTQINDAVLAAAAGDPRAQIYPTRNVLGVTFERHQRFNDGWWEIRAENGVLLCPKGVELVVESLLGQLLENPPRPQTWRNGSWRHDAQFQPNAMNPNGCTDTPTPTQP